MVNGRTFVAGDSILLRRDTTCTGMLWPKGSGSGADAPITLGAYGTGALPIVDGGSNEAAVKLFDQQGWKIQNLETRGGNPRGISIGGNTVRPTCRRTPITTGLSAQRFCEENPMVTVPIHSIAHASTTRADQPTPYHLSPEEIRFFDENGYLILRKRIPAPLLERLQAAGDAWIAQGQAFRDVPATRWDVDYAFAERDGRRLMYRVNYLHNKGYAASLELLGCPQVLAIAESLCGPNLVPTYESMVFKQEGDGAVIIWHQDAIYPRRHRIFNIDVYLDHSVRGAGALRVIPRTHQEQQDLCALTERYGWDVPGVIHAEMEPGDILLHDVMVVYGSEATTGNAMRACAG